MSILRASRLLATTVVAGMLLSGVSLAIAEEGSETSDPTVHSDVIDTAASEVEDVVEVDGAVETEMPPAEVEDVTEDAADEVLTGAEEVSEEVEPAEAAAVDLSPVVRNGAPKAKPTKVE